MLSYCMKSRKNTGNKNSKVAKTKNLRRMLVSKSAFSGNRKSNLIKQQEASGLLSGLGIKTPLKNMSLLFPLLF